MISLIEVQCHFKSKKYPNLCNEIYFSSIQRLNDLLNLQIKLNFQKFISMQKKPYKFQCILRPKMFSYQRGYYIGRVIEQLQQTIIKSIFKSRYFQYYHQFTCFDNNNPLLFTINVSYCQPGLFCMLLFQSYSEIKSQIIDRKNRKLFLICHLFWEVH
ncbi:unnamed protein product [Paramecium primaurelia]|uniref:Uncharacterized protein n=1 Tax=Paramecium primaurelia TaxID=5886 RepID=A0A8S1MBI4_PARPR|nr:unnamed protein product [Paramecium primaurelia]